MLHRGFEWLVFSLRMELEPSVCQEPYKPKKALTFRPAALRRPGRVQAGVGMLRWAIFPRLGQLWSPLFCPGGAVSLTGVSKRGDNSPTCQFCAHGWSFNPLRFLSFKMKITSGLGQPRYTWDFAFLVHARFFHKTSLGITMRRLAVSLACSLMREA